MQVRLPWTLSPRPTPTFLPPSNGAARSGLFLFRMNFPCLISLLWWRLTSPHPWGHNGRCSGGRQERVSLEAFKIFILGVVAFYLSKILVSHFGSGRGSQFGREAGVVVRFFPSPRGISTRFPSGPPWICLATWAWRSCKTQWAASMEEGGSSAWKGASGCC